MRKKQIFLGLLLVLLIALGLIWTRHAEAPAQKTNRVANDTPVATPPEQSTTFDKSTYSTTDPASLWVVVNKQHPVSPQTYVPSDLVSVGNGQRMRAAAATALAHMFDAAKTAGFSLRADSGYRSYSDQVAAYGSLTKAYGTTYADTVSARPGYSEHQTGWAVDIGLTTGQCSLDDCLGNLPAGKWLAANAYRYGFLLRYTAADSDVTGYSPEPWHFRYIGTALATEMHDQHIATLEQFFGVTGGDVYKRP